MDFYIDSDYRLHVSNPDGAFRKVEIHPSDRAFFQDKCQTFIEGYCYDDSNGYLCVYPWKSYDEIDEPQRQYEHAQLAQYESALAEIEKALGV